MSEYCTIVIKMPTDADDKAKLRRGLDIIKPYQTAMSMEDEMTILDMIENHPDFRAYIADDARKQVADLHDSANKQPHMDGDIK